MIFLKPFNKEDFSRLIAWIPSKELLMQCAGSGFYFPLSNDQLLAHLEDPANLAFSVVDLLSEEIIGYAEIVRIDEKEVKFCRLLIGDPDLRGAGLGKFLVKELVYEAIALFNPELISLNVYQHNLPAIKCYSSLGFVVNDQLSTVTMVNGVEWKSLRMSLFLS